MLRTSLISLLFTSTGLAAQPQHNNWYFGFGAGLTFNTPTPTALTNGVLSTDEGCASMSDAAGGLLFYTDGEEVWDRTHAQMPNGWGLGGGFSSTQSALIVPFQDDSSLYYLFTVPNEAGYWGGTVVTGLSYSIVDMTLNSGFGDVTVKNIALADSMVEKLAATQHTNGKDVWVLAHEWNSDAYFAWLVTCTAVEGPVISHVGRMMEDDGSGGYPTIGCMQFSPQGDRLAAAWTQFNAGVGQGQMDLLFFDRSTGVLSNAIPITHATTGWDIRAYGTCFSPDGSRLYLSENGLQGGIGFSRVLQYDMFSASIPGSEVQVAGANIEAHGTMQKGPDGMIYIARTNGYSALSRIQFPNAIGPACGYQDVGVSIAPNLSTWGLPNNWNNYLPVPPYDIVPFSDTLVCNGSITLDATYDHPFHTPQYLWNTGATDPSIIVDESGIYWVRIMLPCDTISDTVRVNGSSIAVDLGPDLRLCEGGSHMAEAPADGQVLWEDGSTDPVRTITDEGVYWLQITDTLGCAASDTLAVAVSDCDCTLFLPNAFTPDGDGINDAFAAVHDCELLAFDLRLFDRWGEEIFHATDPGSSWNGVVNGRSVPSSVFAWVLDYRFFNGESEQRSRRNGHVVVVR